MKFFDIELAIKNWLVEALKIAEDTHTTLPDNKKEFYVSDSGSIEIRMGKNWRGSEKLGNLSLICGIESYQKITDLIEKHQDFNEKIGKHLLGFSFGLDFIVNRFLISLLDSYVTLKQDYTFDEEVYYKIITDLFSIIENSLSNAKIIVPIENFQIEPELIELDENIRIRKLDLPGIAKIMNRSKIFHLFFHPNFPGFFHSILEIDINFPWLWKNTEKFEDRDDYLERLNFSSNFLSVINHIINQEIILYKSIMNRPINVQVFDIFYDGIFQSSVGNDGLMIPCTRDYTKGGSDIFSTEDASNYKELRTNFFNFSNKEEQQRLFIAMRKLSSGIDRIYLGDSIFEMISGLEGLLVNSTTEVSHRCAENVAILLEKEYDKRCELNKKIKDAYGIRSKVAHGSLIFDQYDSIINIRVEKKISEFAKQKTKFDSYRELYYESRISLNKSIIICLKRKSTKFDWKNAIFNSDSMPF